MQAAYNLAVGYEIQDSIAAALDPSSILQQPLHPVTAS